MESRYIAKTRAKSCISGAAEPRYRHQPYISVCLTAFGMPERVSEQDRELEVWRYFGASGWKHNFTQLSSLSRRRARRWGHQCDCM